jgi:hypothetical protein
VSPITAPQGMAHVIEPQVIREQDYMRVQPASKPYEAIPYSQWLWIC